MNSKLKMTTAQLINCHCDTLSQASISKLIGMIGTITHDERIGIKSSPSQGGNIAERWILKQFISNHPQRHLISEALFKRWEPRTDKL